MSRVAENTRSKLAARGISHPPTLIREVAASLFANENVPGPQEEKSVNEGGQFEFAESHDLHQGGEEGYEQWSENNVLAQNELFRSFIQGHSPHMHEQIEIAETFEMDNTHSEILDRHYKEMSYEIQDRHSKDMSTDRHYKDMSNEFVDQIFPSARAMEEDTHLIEKDMSSGASSHYNRNAGAKEIESESFHSAIRMKSSAERDTHNKDMSSGVYSHYKRNVSANDNVHIFSSQPASCSGFKKAYNFGTKCQQRATQFSL